METHKALGTWYNDNGTLTTNITRIKEKLPFMIKTVKEQASPTNLGNLAIQGRLKLCETVLIPSVLHNTEAYANLTKDNVDTYEQIQSKTLKDLLELPQSTPYYPLLIETGCWTMEARISYRRLMFYHNLLRSDDKRMAKKVVLVQQKYQSQCTKWYNMIINDMEKYQIELDPLETKKSTWKKAIKSNISRINAMNLKELCVEKTKSRWIKDDEVIMKDYLKVLSLTESIKVMKMRLNMTKIPGNYKNNSVNKCPLCGEKENNLEHYFECKKVNRIRKSFNITMKDMYSLKIDILQNVALFGECLEIMLQPVL